MMQNTVVDVRYLPGEREGDEVGKRTPGKLTDLPSQAQGAGAVKRGHLHNLPGGEGRLVLRQCAHFLEQAQFHALMPGLIDAGQAVRSEAYVDSRLHQPAQGKRVVVEIEVTARTMDDVHLAPS